MIFSGGGQSVLETLGLHSFSYSTDGDYPTDSLNFDATGNFYGTTSQGGPAGVWGASYKMTPSQGSWTFSLLSILPAQTRETHMEELCLTKMATSMARAMQPTRAPYSK